MILNNFWPITLKNNNNYEMYHIARVLKKEILAFLIQFIDIEIVRLYRYRDKK